MDRFWPISELLQGSSRAASCWGWAAQRCYCSSKCTRVQEISVDVASLNLDWVASQQIVAGKIRTGLFGGLFALADLMFLLRPAGSLDQTWSRPSSRSQAVSNNDPVMQSWLNFLPKCKIHPSAVGGKFHHENILTT